MPRSRRWRTIRCFPLDAGVRPERRGKQVVTAGETAFDISIVVRDTGRWKSLPSNRRILSLPQVVASDVVMGGTFFSRNEKRYNMEVKFNDQARVSVSAFGQSFL